MKKLFFWTVALILMIFIATGCVAEETEADPVPSSVEIMNQRELWYDANDWFIMVETNEGLLGVYYATYPVEHVPCDVPYFWGGGSYVITWGELQEMVYANVSADVPEWTPVLIYEEDFDWGDRYDWK